MLRRALFVLILLAFLTCSPDRPTPVAPASKANCPLCGILGTEMENSPAGDGEAQDNEEDQTTSSDSTETETVSSDSTEIEVDSIYITYVLDSSLSEGEKRLVDIAMRQWDAVIKQGHPNGLEIDVAITPQAPFTLGHASIYEAQTHRGYSFPTKCSIGLLSVSELREGDVVFEKIALHEIGHCLGLGGGSEWYKRVEYETGLYESGEYTVVEIKENGDEVRDYHMVEGLVKPSFTGVHAQEAFIQATEGKWGDYPIVPLRWDQGNGEDAAHLSSPILMRGAMSIGGHYGNTPFIQISSIEEAMLKDLGYIVSNTAEDIRLLSGFRHIYIEGKNNAGQRVINGIGVETLFFPKWPLDFTHEYLGYAVIRKPFNTMWGDPSMACPLKPGQVWM